MLPSTVNGVRLSWGFDLSERDRVVFCVGPMPRPPHVLPRVRKHSGEVYFIQRSGDGAIKIGWTALIDKTRQVGVQVGSVEHLTVLATVPGSRADERLWQSRFEDEHIRGEWFRPSKALLETIAELSPIYRV